jgi:MFS family permease
MAITHTKDNQLNSAPVKVSNYIRIILALALSGLAELASLFFIQPLLPVLAVEYDVPVSQVSIILSAETALLAIGLLFTGRCPIITAEKIDYRFAATWRTADDALSSG